jgi:pimeloyl-ACP methyl ester carboxylesterase
MLADSEYTFSRRCSMKALLLEDMQVFLRYEYLSGESPAMIYLPGLMMPSHASFASVLHEHPAPGRQRSILVDLLGSGFSDAPQEFDYSLEEHARVVARLLDELDLMGCNVVGYSMGGALSQPCGNDCCR